ncbi:MAG: hypothetical protein AAGK37_13080 [Pseudomonadota bacterium]
MRRLLPSIKRRTLRLWLSLHERLLDLPTADTGAARGLALSRLGSDYGGWTVHDAPSLNDGLVMSAGLGEDGSFDTELARRFGAKVVIVDPTPRAIDHFAAIAARVGQPAQSGWSDGGQQPPEAYDMTGLVPGQLALQPVALWDKACELRFFAPKNPDHVSHSVVDLQNDYAMTGAHLSVEALTPAEVLAACGESPDRLALLKIDIEGAEVEVLCHLAKTDLRPAQIAVEYDELIAPTVTGLRRVSRAHKALSGAGYTCVHCEDTNFLYIHRSAMPSRAA